MMKHILIITKFLNRKSSSAFRSTTCESRSSVADAYDYNIAVSSSFSDMCKADHTYMFSTNATIKVASGSATDFLSINTIPGSNTFCNAASYILISNVTNYYLPSVELNSAIDFIEKSDDSATVHYSENSTACNYLWRTSITQPSTAVEDFAIGGYSVTVTDLNHCFHTDSMAAFTNVHLTLMLQVLVVFVPVLFMV